MTNLTEKYKRGELEESKWYYLLIDKEATSFIRNKDFVSIDQYQYAEVGFDCWEDDWIKEVLAPVPTYEETVAKDQEIAELKARVEELEKDVCRWMKSLEDTVDEHEKEIKELRG